MKKKIYSLLLAFVLAFQLTPPITVFAEPTEDEIPNINAVSAIMVDQKTGRVLFEKNADEKLFPASMTKVLTSLLSIEYIKPDEVVKVGTEINYVPWDSSLAGLEVGQSISGKNLIRGLIIPSGNEAANTVAYEVVKRKTGNTNISYSEAELQFAEIMNERAKSLGATNTNFVTPSGYHDPNHYTTARDMALIANAAMKNEVIKEVASEISFNGMSVEQNVSPDMKLVQHKWYTHNQIINPTNPYYYKYATGLKTGFTDDAGECLVGTASYNNMDLLVVIFNSEDPGRWLDAKNLFEYGFSHYKNVELQVADNVIQDVALDDPVKGTSETLSILANESVSVLLTKEEEQKVIHNITFNPILLADTYTETGSPKLRAPMFAGEEVGTIHYKIGDELLYEGPVVSAVDVQKRTFLTDLNYYTQKVKEFIFSWRIVPVTAAVIFASIYIVRGYKIRKQQRKRVKYKSRYNFKRRY